MSKLNSNKKIKYLIKTILLVVVFFGVSTNISALSPKDSVQQYHVDMDVRKDGTIEVHNKMVVKFEQQRHGIYVAVPYKYDTSSKTLNKQIYTPITNVNVKDRTFETEKEGNYVFIRIGDEDRYVDGLQTYEYSYILRTRDLKLDKDLFYFNIIGDKWDYDMRNVSFNITMPQEFNEKVNFYITNQDNSELDYIVKNNVISGKYKGTLKSNHGITIKLELEKGYFDYPQEKLNNNSRIIMLIFLVVSIIAYIIFGRDRKLIRPIQFNAPKGFSPAMLGYVVDETLDRKDTTSLLVYWASKGYMKIKELEDDIFEFTMIKEIDDSEIEIEKAYFNELFKEDIIVTSENITLSFVEMGQTMNPEYKDYFSGEKLLYSKTSTKIKYLLGLISIILFSSITGIFTNDIFGFGVEIAIVMAISAVVMLILFGVLDNIVKKKGLRKKVTTVLLSVIYFVVLLVIVFVIMLATSMEVLTALIFMLILYISTFIIVGIKKRTLYGDQVLGESYGFRDFIKKVEVERLEMFVSENPSFFYDILPYAYTLGLSNVWIKKFENIKMPAVDWYESPNMTMTDFIFLSHLNHSLSSMAQATSYHPDFDSSDSSFGGFSGGGSAGGGFGGGGGGSW